MYAMTLGAQEEVVVHDDQSRDGQVVEEVQMRVHAQLKVAAAAEEVQNF